MTKDKVINCTSCKVEVANLNGSVIFDCPNCGKIKIVRCVDCRNKSIKYKCPECGFEGPN